MSIEVQDLTAVEPSLDRPLPRQSLVLRLVRGVLLYLVPLLVIMAGVAGAIHLMKTAPKAERRNTEKQTTPAQVIPAERISTHAAIQVMGTVVASQQILLHPRISGEVVKLDPGFVPGGRFQAGDFLLQIDPKDYELTVEKSKSQIAEMEYQLKLEQGHQEIAQREWELLRMQSKSSELDDDLALRKPQLIKAQAALEAAKAALAEAQLALDRTTIRAPFDCIIETEGVDLGSQVTPQTQIARLIGTDEYWVQAAVPVDQLSWICFPDQQGRAGSPATIRQEVGSNVQGEWRGAASRLMSGLEPQGRMAQVLITVPQPLDAADGSNLPLLIGAYVNVTIEGHPIKDVIALPRNVLRDDGRVWVMNDRSELEIREVQSVWRNRERVLVSSGIREGERVVLTDLSAPVAGMALEVRESRPQEGVADTADEPAHTPRAVAEGQGGQ